MIKLELTLPEGIEFRSLQRIDQPNITGWSVLLRKTLPPNTYRRGAYGLGQHLTIEGAVELALKEINSHVEGQAIVPTGLAASIKITL